MAMQRTLYGFSPRLNLCSLLILLIMIKTFRLRRKETVRQRMTYDCKRKAGFIDSWLIDSHSLKKQTICVLAHFFFALNVYSVEVNNKFKMHNNSNITRILKVRKVKIIANIDNITKQIDKTLVIICLFTVTL